MTDQDTQLNKANRTLSFIVGAFLVALPIWYYAPISKGQVETDEKVEELATDTEIILKSISKFKEIFEAGDSSNLWGSGAISCPLIPLSQYVSKQGLKCQPFFVDCVLKSNYGTIQVKHKDFTYNVRAKPFFTSPVPEVNGEILTFAPKILPHQSIPTNSTKKLFYEFELFIDNAQKNPKTHKILIEDTCGDTYLPQKSYVYREHSREDKVDKIWNNFNKQIYIDKAQIRNWEILVYKMAKQSSLQIPSDAMDWFKPAVGLFPEDMERYCSDIGKELAQSHVMDAGSFFPLEPNNILYQDRSFAPFPWTKRSISEPILIYQNRDKQFDNKFCDKVFTADCIEQNVLAKSHNTDAISWIGLLDLLGGTPEYVKNIINPSNTFRVSSRFLGLKNRLNRVGRRLTLEEVSNRSELPSEILNYLTKTTNYSFRCMRVEHRK